MGAGWQTPGRPATSAGLEEWSERQRSFSGRGERGSGNVTAAQFPLTAVYHRS